MLKHEFVELNHIIIRKNYASFDNFVKKNLSTNDTIVESFNIACDNNCLEMFDHIATYYMSDNDKKFFFDKFIIYASTSKKKNYHLIILVTGIFLISMGIIQKKRQI